MNRIAEIFATTTGAKALSDAVAAELVTGKAAVNAWLEFYATATATERGRCLEALEFVTRTAPKLAEPCETVLLAASADKNPTLQREASRVVANTAAVFPEWATSAVPLLLKNTEHEGTVVRWSAALALTEIAKANPATRKKLLPVITKLAETGEGGVRSIYLRALKALAKL
jgi:hypothetical protein